MPRLSKVMGKKPANVHAAQQRVHDAIDRGEMKKPTKCASCGKEAKLQFAHNNYADRLSGKWLCVSCHHKQDRKDPNGGGNGAKGTVKGG